MCAPAYVHLHTQNKQTVNLTDIHMNQHTTTSLFEEIGLYSTKKNVMYVERKGNQKPTSNASDEV